MFQAVLVADWAQTRQIAQQPDKFREKNPILGATPSAGRVDAYFLAAGALHWVISENLSPDWRERWQLMTIIIQTGTVYQNYQIGLEARF